VVVVLLFKCVACTVSIVMLVRIQYVLSLSHNGFLFSLIDEAVVPGALSTTLVRILALLFV